MDGLQDTWSGHEAIEFTASPLFFLLSRHGWPRRIRSWFGAGGIAIKSSSRISWKQSLLILGILLVAVNLRPSITGIGPLIGTIAQHTGLTPAVSGILTTLPLIAFGLISPLSPRLVRRFGLETALFLGLLCLTLGTLIRATGSIAALLFGMFLVGSGVALGNVLLPSLVKRDFPRHIGLMTGLYSTMMSSCAALASGISVPMALRWGLGWRGSLAIWAVLGTLAMLLWIPQLRRHQRVPIAIKISLWRSRLAWQVTLFMGLQSLIFYVNVAWLPNLLHDRGMSLASAGWMLSWMQFISLPGSFIMPILAGKRPHQRHLVVAISLLFMLGYAGLLTQGLHLAWVWVGLVGLAGGASLSLALVFFSLRTKTPEEATELSGMAQSVGYLLAAVGPVSIGLLHHATHSWTAPLIMLLVVAILVGWTGLFAGRQAFVETTSRTEPIARGRV